MVLFIILLIVLGVAATYFIIPGVLSLFVDSKKEYSKDSKLYRWVLNTATAIGLKVMRIKVSVNGAEKLPKEQRLLFVGNHRSNFDPIITWYVFKKWKISYISKESNFKIPFFGGIIRRCCFMSIDRTDPRKAIDTVNRASKLLKNGEVSVGVYPEGTRSKSGELLPFHSGVLRIAQKGKTAVAVIAVSGTENIAKNYPFHSSHIKLTVVDVIPAEHVCSVSTGELCKTIREKIEECVK